MRDREVRHWRPRLVSAVCTAPSAHAGGEGDVSDRQERLQRLRGEGQPVLHEVRVHAVV